MQNNLFNMQVSGSAVYSARPTIVNIKWTGRMELRNPFRPRHQQVFSEITSTNSTEQGTLLFVRKKV